MVVSLSSLFLINCFFWHTCDGFLVPSGGLLVIEGGGIKLDWDNSLSSCDTWWGKHDQLISGSSYFMVFFVHAFGLD